MINESKYEANKNRRISISSVIFWTLNSVTYLLRCWRRRGCHPVGVTSTSSTIPYGIWGIQWMSSKSSSNHFPQGLQSFTLAQILSILTATRWTFLKWNLKMQKTKNISKVIFSEKTTKNLRDLHLTFVLCSASQK